MKPINPSEFDAPRLGSPYDPVLTGVASGLTRLFPPIENGPRTRDDEAQAHDESETDDCQS